MADSDLDPKAFLQTVRDLSDKRQKEDNERYEKLEAEIMQDRSSRLARRLERERSLSPEKTPRSTPNGGTPTSTATPSSPSRDFTAARHDSLRGRAMSPLNGMESHTPTERSSSPSKASPSAAMPSRSNTLSWQQRRPNSTVRSRPLSMVAAQNSALRSPSPVDREGESGAKQDPTRDDIAKSLGAKDPTWFKQTADRGLGSAAYRRNKEEIEDAGLPTQRRPLPGLNKEPSLERPNSVKSFAEVQRTDSQSRLGSSRLERPSNDASNVSEISRTEDKPFSYPELSRTAPSLPNRASTSEAEPSSIGRTAPSLQNRTLVDRPASPTKGMGGFVQSAMLKRSDSVSKRWSVQTGGGLSRQDSTASIRSGFGSIRDGGSMAGSRSMPRLDTDTGSRPTSSHSTISNLQLQEPDGKDHFVKPSGSLHSRAKSVASLREPPTVAPEVSATFSPPLSPSKRWSPTKASWLESALARPESPKPSPTHSNTPSWMADLNKAKQQRNSGECATSQSTPDVEIGTAATKSFQSGTTKEAVSFGQTLLKRSDSRELPAHTSSPGLMGPPTRSKPSSLASMPQATPSAFQGLGISTDPVKEAPTESIHTEESVATPVSRIATPATTRDMAVKDPATPPKPPTIASIKPKPGTPPKKDFRSTLKPRAAAASSAKEEPEFKNVFGKLKKTQTEKYVAPDLLKDNILRGKSGLAMTDGPQKTERRDELKESLLKKKEEIKSKAADIDPTQPKRLASVPSAETPEALMKKKQLGRTESLQSLDKGRRDITPEALARHKTLKSKAAPTVPSKTSSLNETSPEKSQALMNASAADALPSNSEQTNFQPKATIAEEPVSTKLVKDQSQPKSYMQSTADEQTKSSNFADRFNPALANVLARGPPVLKSSTSADRTVSPPYMSTSRPATETEDTSSGQQLTHMTKSRAKGPKRRKPNAKDSEPEIKAVKRSSVVPQTTSSAATPFQPPPKSAAVRAVSITMSKPAEKEKPTTPTKSVSLSKMMKASPQITISPSSQAMSDLASIPMASSRKVPTPNKPQPSAPNTSAVRSSPSADSTRSGTNGLRNAGPVDEDKENVNGTPSVKGAAAMWSRQAQAKPSPQRSAPIDLPSRQDEEAAMKSAGLLSTSPLRYKATPTLGLGISSEKRPLPTSPDMPLSPPASAGLPPKPAKSSRVVSSLLPSVQDSRTSAGSGTTEAGRVLSNYFGSLPFSERNLQIDTPTALSTRAIDSSKIKTLRKTIQEISGDGKLTPLPAQEEHVLYDASMYILTHVFGSASGARTTEVYLWTGSSVSESAVEDAQLFGKRVAKEATAGQRSSANLLVIRQTREPSEFFQALGGIVIVRRGSRADAATRPYMLCGRPHMGQMAFDEVDIHSSSLHSAFPYIVANPVTLQATRVYLWKGSTCGPEAIGSARLISMDLDTSGDITEVDQDAESPEFLALLSASGSTIPKVNLGPSMSERSTARLFRVESARPRRSSSALANFWPTSLLTRRPSWTGSRPTSSASNGGTPTLSPPAVTETKAMEISPFAQQDLEAENCYVLDCVDTIYVLPGPLLVSSNTEFWRECFVQACLFAADYAILAAGEEDRARIPKAEVALGGLPREAKLLFRGWDERRGLWGTAGLMAGKTVDGEERLSVSDVVEVCCRA